MSVNKLPCLVCFFFCRMVAKFIESLYNVYCDLYFTYLEINPLGK